MSKRRLNKSCGKSKKRQGSLLIYPYSFLSQTVRRVRILTDEALPCPFPSQTVGRARKGKDPPHVTSTLNQTKELKCSLSNQRILKLLQAMGERLNNSRLGIPYWDVTEHKGVPKVFDDITNFPTLFDRAMELGGWVKAVKVCKRGIMISD